MPREYVEPAHEALVRAWDTALEWRRGEAEKLPLQRAVTQAARAWDGGRGTGGLWTGDKRLDRVRELLREDPYWLNAAEAQFIQESARRRTRNGRALWGSILGVVIVLSIAGNISFLTHRQSLLLRARSNYEEAQRRIGDMDFIGAEQAASASIEDEDRLETRQLILDSRLRAYRRAWGQDTGHVLAISYDGKVFASESAEHTVRFYCANNKVALTETPVQQSRITKAAFARTGYRLTFGTKDGELREWDPVAKTLRTAKNAPKGHEISAISYGPDDKFIAFSTLKSQAASSKPELWLWSADRDVHRIAEVNANVWGLDWSPRGDEIITGDNNYEVSKYRLNKGDWIRTFHKVRADDVIMSAAFSPDGNSFAIASADGLVRQLETHSGNEIRRFAGHAGDVLDVAFAPDGRTIVSAGNDETVRLWDITQGKNINTIRTGSSVFRVRLTGDDSIASGNDSGGVAVFSPAYGAYKTRLGRSGDIVTTLAFHPRSTQLITASQSLSPDGSHHPDSVITLYDVASKKKRASFSPRIGQIVSFALDPQGQSIAAAGGFSGVKLWQLDSLAAPPIQIATPKAQQGITFDQKGRLFCGGWDQEFRIINPRLLRPPLRQIAVPSFPHITPQPESNQSVIRVVPVPETDYFVTGGGSGALQKWGADGKRIWSVESAIEPGRGIWGLAVAPDGTWIAIGGTDRTVRLYSARGLSLGWIYRAESTVVDLAISPDGKWMAAASGHQVLVWRLSAGSPPNAQDFPIKLRTFDRPVWALSYSPDSKYLAVADLNGFATLIETRAFEEITTARPAVLHEQTQLRHAAAGSHNPPQS